jgi:transmembrane sensor
VLGTEFNIRDIEDEPDVTVTVKEGRVKFTDKDEVSYVYLESGEEGILHKNSGIIEKIRRADENDLFWKTRTLLFRNTRLSVVFKTLEKIFKIEIDVENSDILNCTLTGRFQDATAEEILDKIALSFDFKIQKQDKAFTVTGNGCEAR